MKEAIEPWRLVICKSAKPPEWGGESLKDLRHSMSLGLTAPPGGRMKKFPEPTASRTTSWCPSTQPGRPVHTFPPRPRILYHPLGVPSPALWVLLSRGCPSQSSLSK